MLLPIAPSPENKVTCRNGMRSLTAQSRSGHGSLSQREVSIHESGCFSGVVGCLASARLNETTGSCRVIVTPLRLPGCNVSSSMFIFPNKIIEIADKIGLGGNHLDARLRQALDALGGGSLAVSAGVIIDGDGHAFDPRQDGKFGETVFVDQRPDRFELKELAGRQNS